MKRTPNYPRAGARFEPHLLNFTEDQLAGIGAVAMTFNVAEELIDGFLVAGFNLKVDAKEILTRIGGLDGKFHLVKHIAKTFEMPDDIQKALANTLGDGHFGLLKKYRDGVIHARIFDRAKALGIVVERRNREAEVLLTPNALNGLAARLEVIYYELKALKKAYRVQCQMVYLAEKLAPKKEQLEAEYQAAMARFQVHQTQRLSLPPLPKFPGEAQ